MKCAKCSEGSLILVSSDQWYLYYSCNYCRAEADFNRKYTASESWLPLLEWREEPRSRKTKEQKESPTIVDLLALSRKALEVTLFKGHYSTRSERGYLNPPLDPTGHCPFCHSRIDSPDLLSNLAKALSCHKGDCSWVEAFHTWRKIGGKL